MGFMDAFKERTVCRLRTRRPRIRKNKAHDKAVEDAYCALIEYRRWLEEDGKDEAAERIENIYKMLWVQCLNKKAPWSGEPACDNP